MSRGIRAPTPSPARAEWRSRGPGTRGRIRERNGLRASDYPQKQFVRLDAWLKSPRSPCSAAMGATFQRDSSDPESPQTAPRRWERRYRGARDPPAGGAAPDCSQVGPESRERFSLDNGECLSLVHERIVARCKTPPQYVRIGEGPRVPLWAVDHHSHWLARRPKLEART